MTQVALTCRSIGDLGNGFAGRQIDEALQRVTDDVFDRGHDLKERSVIITVVVQRVDKGEYHAWATVEAKVPKRRCPETSSKILDRKSDGQKVLAFMPDNAEDAEQPTFYDDEAESEA